MRIITCNHLKESSIMSRLKAEDDYIACEYRIEPTQLILHQSNTFSSITSDDSKKDMEFTIPYKYIDNINWHSINNDNKTGQEIEEIEIVLVKNSYTALSFGDLPIEKITEKFDNLEEAYKIYGTLKLSWQNYNRCLKNKKSIDEIKNQYILKIN